MMLNDAPSLAPPGLTVTRACSEFTHPPVAAEKATLPYPTQDEVDAIRRNARLAQSRVVLDLLRSALR